MKIWDQPIYRHIASKKLPQFFPHQSHLRPQSQQLSQNFVWLKTYIVYINLMILRKVQDSRVANLVYYVMNIICELIIKIHCIELTSESFTNFQKYLE